MDAEFVDRIYEAAATPQRWPEVLGMVADLAGASAAGLLAIDPVGAVRFVSTRSYRDALDGYGRLGQAAEDPRPRLMLDGGQARFVRDLDLLGPAELGATPLYRDVLRPRGIGWTAVTALAADNADLLVFDLARRIDRGPFDSEALRQLDAYRPHLARAALLSHRLGLNVTEGMAQALENIGLPAAVITQDGRALTVNPAFGALAPQFRLAAFDRVTIAHPQAARLFGLALDELRSSVPAHAMQSIAVPSGPEAPAFVAHVIPIEPQRFDVFGRAAAVLLVTEVAAPQAPLTKLLNGLFDLTPAEARLARALAGGTTTREFAASHNLSPETVKKQLQQIFAKTGTKRQAELVNLLAGISPIGRDRSEG